MHEQNPAQNPAGSYAPMPGSPEPKTNKQTIAIIALSVVVVLLLLGGGVALFASRSTSSTTEAATGLPSSSGTTSTAAGQPTTTVELPADDAPTTVAPVSNPSGGQNPTSNNGGGNSGGGSNSGGAPAPQTPQAPPTTQAPSGPAPVITSFVTPENIDCHNGMSQMFSASWSTTNAVKVTISIDGAGVYKTYGPTGSDSLPFECSSPHTFVLTAYGQDGSTVTKSITLQPRNVQTPGPEPEEDI